MRSQNLMFHIVLSILIFLLWAGFAILCINKCPIELPMYVIGRLCIWDYLIMIGCILISHLIIRSWGYPTITLANGKRNYSIDIRYIYFFAVYFIFGIAVAIWQFYIFSQNF